MLEQGRVGEAQSTNGVLDQQVNSTPMTHPPLPNIIYELWLLALKKFGFNVSSLWVSKILL